MRVTIGKSAGLNGVNHGATYWRSKPAFIESGFDFIHADSAVDDLPVLHPSVPGGSLEHFQ